MGGRRKADVSFGVRLSNCTCDHSAMARGVFLCRQWKLVVLLGENVFFRDRGNPLDTLNDSIVLLNTRL